MSEGESYIKCKNCHQEILSSKMFLHEGFCLRNNKLCPECDKVFLVQEYEEHLKTHSIKKPSQISEHRKNCKHHQEIKKEEIPKPKPKKEIEIPQKKEIIIDDNLGLKQCEYCTNLFEDLQTHLIDCDVKKMIEMENEQYFRDVEKRKKEDDDLAQKLSKEKIMDISKDKQIAEQIQKNLQPLNDVNQDEEMAKQLQQKFQMENTDISKDEEIARKLQNELNNNININNDEEFARRLQQQEDMNVQNQYQNQNDNNNNDYGGQYHYGFNIPERMNNDF